MSIKSGKIAKKTNIASPLPSDDIILKGYTKNSTFRVAMLEGDLAAHQENQMTRDSKADSRASFLVTPWWFEGVFSYIWRQAMSSICDEH